MSAETLREAATLMRERAKAATQGPWVSRQEHGRDYTDEGWSCVLVTSISAVSSPDVATTALPGDDHDLAIDDAEHIASWHPAVALAVADWLIQVATARESIDGLAKAQGNPLGGGSDMFLAQERHALTVARAYLGSDQ